jgi:hypothetical protein
MTDEAMSPLRRRMIEDITIRKFAPKTQHDYVQRVKNFAAFLGRSPDTASFDDVPCRRPCGSVLHVFLDVHLVVGGRVDSAVAIDCDADRRLHLRVGRHRRRNEVRHLAVVHAADAYAALAARIVVGGALIVRGLGIDHVQHVVLVDGDAAWPAELPPGRKKVSILVEDHDATIATVGDVEAVLAVEGDRMR